MTDYQLLSVLLSSALDEDITVTFIQNMLIDYNSKIQYIQKKIKPISNQIMLINYKDDNYKITPFDLEVLCIRYDIAFLYISKLYSSHKSKYELIFKINKELYKNRNQYSISYINNINVILLYDYYDNDNYLLSQIVHNNKLTLKIKDLFKIQELNTYIKLCSTTECDELKYISNFIN